MKKVKRSSYALFGAEKKDISCTSMGEELESFKIKNTESLFEYSCLDACVCCGQYMAEGTGMVCSDCLR